MKRSIAIALMLSLALTACQSNPFKRNGGGNDASADGLLAPAGLQASSSQRFADVPLPMDTKEDVSRTFVYESSSVKIGRMVYTVKASVNDVSQFYIRECANMGWTLDSALQAEGVMLNFKRPGKLLHVSVTRTGIVDRSSMLVLNYIPDDRSAVLEPNPIQSSPL